jgi:hypothetical protein
MAKPTTYYVMRSNQANVELPAVWTWVADSKASNANAAVREAVSLIADGDGETAGTYVAVPARSWKPVTVTTETRTILKLEQPDTAA